MAGRCTHAMGGPERDPLCPLKTGMRRGFLLQYQHDHMHAAHQTSDAWMRAMESVCGQAPRSALWRALEERVEDIGVAVQLQHACVGIAPHLKHQRRDPFLHGMKRLLSSIDVNTMALLPSTMSNVRVSPVRIYVPHCDTCISSWPWLLCL